MAGKGGGAWKVAYADFVTAMMAFFLVMWICGQDQKLKRAVSYYFTDPFGASNMGTSKKPYRTGSIKEVLSAGTLPQSESVALGQGRNAYTEKNDFGPGTKIVGDWLHAQPEGVKYWQKQAAKHREMARQSNPNAKSETIDKWATSELAKQLKEEVSRDIPNMSQSVYRDLLLETIAGVNWDELAEDILEH